MGLGFNWFEHLGAGGYYARWEKYPLTTHPYPDMDDKKGWDDVKELKVSIAIAEKLNESAGKAKVENGMIKLKISPFSLLGLKSK
jgi:hypothetical protein